MGQTGFRDLRHGLRTLSNIGGMWFRREGRAIFFVSFHFSLSLPCVGLVFECCRGGVLFRPFKVCIVYFPDRDSTA